VQRLLQSKLAAQEASDHDHSVCHFAQPGHCRAGKDGSGIKFSNHLNILYLKDEPFYECEKNNISICMVLLFGSVIKNVW
jgi:hypothetical protein